MLENKENHKNANGKTGISFASGSTDYKKPSKNAVKKNKARRQLEDLKNKKEFAELWSDL